jgi:hypothetical protein
MMNLGRDIPDHPIVVKRADKCFGSIVPTTTFPSRFSGHDVTTNGEGAKCTDRTDSPNEPNGGKKHDTRRAGRDDRSDGHTFPFRGPHFPVVPVTMRGPIGHPSQGRNEPKPCGGDGGRMEPISTPHDQRFVVGAVTNRLVGHTFWSLRVTMGPQTDIHEPQLVASGATKRPSRPQFPVVPVTIVASRLGRWPQFPAVITTIDPYGP